MGGVNAHVIVEGWNRRNTTKQSALKQTQPARTHAIPYSAANNEGIIELLRVHAAFYKSNRDDIGLENIAYTMQSGRANQASRFCMCASSLMELMLAGFLPKLEVLARAGRRLDGDAVLRARRRLRGDEPHVTLEGNLGAGREFQGLQLAQVHKAPPFVSN